VFPSIFARPPTLLAIANKAFVTAWSKKSDLDGWRLDGRLNFIRRQAAAGVASR
jgi:hypothetical protein